jgi:lactoylglutathione lyase
MNTMQASTAPTTALVKVLRFDHMQMDVADLEESIAFYRDVFGFQLKEVGVRNMVRWAIVGNDSKLYLCMHEYKEGRGVVNDGLEITHFGLIVDDFETVDQRLRDRGLKMVYDKPLQYHSSRSVYFLDPNNYKIEISEFDGGGLDLPQA